MNLFIGRVIVLVAVGCAIYSGDLICGLIFTAGYILLELM